MLLHLILHNLLRKSVVWICGIRLLIATSSDGEVVLSARATQIVTLKNPTKGDALSFSTTTATTPAARCGQARMVTASAHMEIFKMLTGIQSLSSI